MNEIVQAEDFFSEAAVMAACRQVCLSGKFETGEGTCAPACMDQLGDARHECPHMVKVHKKFVLGILTVAHGL